MKKIALVLILVLALIFSVGVPAFAADVYKITYDANGADGAVPVDTMDYVGMVFGQALAQGELIFEGYTFNGWNTQADGNGKSYQAGAWVSATGSVTLYAQWEMDETDDTGDKHDKDKHDKHKPEPKKNIKIKQVSHGNGRGELDFDIKSANGKGYKVYISETKNGQYKEAKASFSSKGANIKDLTNGKTYYVYLEYTDGNDTEISETITLNPRK